MTVPTQLTQNQTENTFTQILRQSIAVRHLYGKPQKRAKRNTVRPVLTLTQPIKLT